MTQIVLGLRRVPSSRSGAISSSSAVAMASSSSSVQFVTRKPPSDAADRQQRLDRAPLVHRGVGLADAVEVGVEVEHETGVGPALDHVVDELRNVGAGRRRTSEYALVAEEHLVDR